MEKFDVVVAGGGHNGLMAAAYLAKAGVKVCVVEKQPYVGGGVTTRELTVPGFKHDMCSTWHGFIQANPVIENDELQLLSKFGLKYIYPDVHTAVLFPDDTNIIFYQDLDKTCESISKISEKDAKAYRKFHDWSVKTLDMVTTGMFSPPASFGSLVSLLDQSDEGRDLLRGMLVSALDICNEWFESDLLKIALTRFAAEGAVAPQIKGTGVVLFVFIPLMHKYGGGLPIGGSGVLSEALARCIEHHGGIIRVSSTVKKFQVSDGEAKGVVLDTGEEILAEKGVITNFHIKQIFPDMVEGASLPSGFEDKVKRIHYVDFIALNSHYALNEAPNFTAGGDVNKAIWVQPTSSNLDEFLRGYENFSYGITDTKFPISICSTLYDKTRAPEGKHTLYLYHFEPYSIQEGGPQKWDEVGEEIADGLLESLRNRTTNMADDNILGRSFDTPLDFERYNPSWPGGNFMHIGSHIWQNMGNRPLPGWSQYRMPVKKLYLTGPSAHPGGGVVGGGRATVQAVMEDLGIDFEKIIV